jgi:hypothetical protein
MYVYEHDQEDVDKARLKSYVISLDNLFNFHYTQADLISKVN